MTYPLRLQERASSDHTAVHGNQLGLSPEQIRLLPLPIDELQISLLVHVLGNNAQLERTVFCFGEVVPVEFYYVRVVLHFH